MKAIAAVVLVYTSIVVCSSDRVVFCIVTLVCMYVSSILTLALKNWSDAFGDKLLGISVGLGFQF